MRKNDLQENEHNISLQFKNLPDDEAYHQKVENQYPIRNSQYHLKSAQTLQTQFHYESLPQIRSFQKINSPQKGSEFSSQISSLSKRSYQTTTNEQIMSRYDIKQIMKRKYQRQEQKWKNWKLALKIILFVIFFPFALIYLLVSFIIKKKAQRQKTNPKQGQRKVKNKQKIYGQQLRRKRTQKSLGTKCCDKLQICCQDYFCYYLCCQFCDECQCCTRCCRKIQNCSKFLCDNSLVQGIEECFSKCFIKNCQKCCRFICCHKRTHERLDTLDRLQRMSQKSQDRIIFN